ncbi:DUF805 domain-containing protein [Oricola thermophila]|uniref:DUF805 domain-containing protein n=1 Tax=Oricola thermophila TaxID=2742145 RepID=A0A6N1VC42_9HYPH|nr:DUF805 domain-containing protein [Oricola thermophila]QKV18591.1 DUF805 domain-containing protein [Oricola thermophila]
MDDKIWFWARDNEQNGPVDIAEIDTLISARKIGPDTLVWREGMSDWQPAATALPGSSIPSSWPSPSAKRPHNATQPPDRGSSGTDAKATHHPSGFRECVMHCFSNYARFRGRARRPEFWYFAIFNYAVLAGLIAIAPYLSNLPRKHELLGVAYLLAVFVPSLAVGVRRLHDTGRSGWWLLIWLVPVIGPIALVILFASRGEDVENRFGPA